jgi:hypothetical protein
MLTDERIHELSALYSLPYSTMSFARALEYTATKPLLERIAALTAQLEWIEQKLFVSRWNGVIDSGAQTTWQIAPDWRHTVAKMVGHKFGEAIDAAISSTQEQT